MRPWSITKEQMKCPKCAWECVALDTDIDEEGNLICPNCKTEMIMIHPMGYYSKYDNVSH